MRREAGASSSLDGAVGAGSRRESMQEHQLQQQPSLTAVGIGRPQTAAIPGMFGGGGGSGYMSPRTAPAQQQGSEGHAQHDHDVAGVDFFEAIREEPALAGGASSGAIGAGLPAGEAGHEGGGVRSRGSLGGGSKGGALPALAGPPGRIKAMRPSTALPAAGAAPPAVDPEAVHRSSTGGSKRHSTGMAGGTAL